MSRDEVRAEVAAVAAAARLSTPVGGRPDVRSPHHRPTAARMDTTTVGSPATSPARVAPARVSRRVCGMSACADITRVVHSETGPSRESPVIVFCED